ncbi:MAG TPA: phosphate ABC transporter permease subunit PstC [Reyranella sp.]|nr:phosphate ABC transporter permease subunit PstC [Reyranella sp.]
MFWIAILALAAFSALSYSLGRRKAAAAAAAQPHSRPGQHGAYVALWSTVPAFLVLFAIGVFGGRIQTALLTADPPAAVGELPDERRILFFQDAVSLSRGRPTSAVAYQGELKTALDATVEQARQYELLLTFGGLALAVLIALIGLLLAYRRLGPAFRARNKVEGWVSGLLMLCSAAALLTTVGIIASLLFESLRFFSMVSPIEFLTGLHWSAQTSLREDQAGGSGAFGAVPLFAGTMLIMLIAMLVAGPVGLFSAIYLAEYARPGVRTWVKPVLEILAGIPTIVFGFFALTTVGPALREGVNAIGRQLLGGPLHGLGDYLTQVQGSMALVAGLVMGIMLIPFVSSLSDDILNAVPQSLRDGSYAMGATKSETVKKVVLPAALPGVVGAFILAVSRAVGETMIVLLAIGQSGTAKLTFNPLDTVSTVTVQIVSLLTGDAAFDRPTTLAAFGLGLTLFVVTLILNVIALRIVQAYREQYD